MFHFLDYFHDDAEEEWNRLSGNELLSQPRSENAVTGNDRNLEACACMIGEKGYLLVQRIGTEHARTQRAMQIARELVLTHERLQRETSKKDNLLHCIFRDLNGPLCGICGTLDLLSNENSRAEWKRLLSLRQLAAVRQFQKFVRRPPHSGKGGAVALLLPHHGGALERKNRPRTAGERWHAILFPPEFCLNPPRHVCRLTRDIYAPSTSPRKHPPHCRHR